MRIANVEDWNAIGRMSLPTTSETTRDIQKIAGCWDIEEMQMKILGYVLLTLCGCLSGLLIGASKQDAAPRLDEIVHKACREAKAHSELTGNEWETISSQLATEIKAVNRGENARPYTQTEIEACFELLGSPDAREAYVAGHLIAGHLAGASPITELELHNCLLFRELFISKFSKDKEFASRFYRFFVGVRCIGGYQMFGDGHTPSLRNFLIYGYFDLTNDIENLENGNAIGKAAFTEAKCLALLCNYAFSYDRQNLRLAKFSKDELIAWSKGRWQAFSLIVILSEFDSESLRWRLNPSRAICYEIGYLQKCKFWMLFRPTDTFERVWPQFPERVLNAEFRVGLPDHAYKPFEHWNSRDALNRNIR